MPDDGVVGFLGTLLSWGFVLFFLVGVIGVGWYYLVWRIERYLVDAAGDRVRRRDQQVRTGHLARRDHRHDRRPPWLGRIVGYGEIDLLTASEAGTSKIRFLPDADGFKKSLLDAKHEHELDVGGGRVLQEAVASAAPAAQDHNLSAEELDSALSRLAELRDRGLLTQSEFDEKKRELLDRL